MRSYTTGSRHDYGEEQRRQGRLLHEIYFLDRKGIGSPLGLRRGSGGSRRVGLHGPLLGFSNTWQLVINTGTTIVTFLMVSIIQNTQNRDSATLHLKLDA